MARPKWIQGDVNPIAVPVATALAVSIGDLIAIVANTAQQASGQAWDTDLPTTQTDFANVFVGISLQNKDANKARVFGNSTDNVLVVATGGVWEFDLASAAVHFNEFYGPAKDTGNALLNQTLVKVSGEGLGVGQCVMDSGSTTRVRIQLLSQLARLARKGS